MKVFKISTKFEQEGRWSDREADLEGYLIKQNDEDDIVEGYVNVLYPTCGEKVRYIKGLHLSDGSLIYMQLVKDDIQPICYCFPKNEEKGFWSGFSRRAGFFPIYPGFPCAQGHATMVLEEITDESKDNIAQQVSDKFSEMLSNTYQGNLQLMSDVKSLTDFLAEDWVFQMRLHCGKW